MEHNIKIEEQKLYPTSIWKTKIPGYGLLNYELEEYIYDLKKNNPKGLKASNEKGWHSPGFDINDKVIVKFINKVDKVLDNILTNLEWDLENYFFGYKNIWSIINNKYSYNLQHHHGDSLLSLAYYVKIPKDNLGGHFYFVDPRVASRQRRPPMKKPESPLLLEKTNAKYNKMFNVEEGDILIFPGWLEHGVKQSFSDEDRIVISANINLYLKEEKKQKGFHPDYFSD